MDAAVVTALAGVAVALVTAVLGPVFVRRAERNDPALGWQAAIKALEDRIEDQDERLAAQGNRIESLEKEVKNLEDTVSTRDRTIKERDRIIDEQSDLIRVQTARIVQLETSWPNGSTPPPVDPAHRALLRQREATG